MNTFVKVTFNSDITRAVCKFLIMIQFQQQIIDNRYYYCSITYEPINSDINHNRRRQQRIFGTSQNNTVDLNFPQGSLLPGTYHFTVNATDSLNTTLIIEGTFEKGESKLKIEVKALGVGEAWVDPIVFPDGFMKIAHIIMMCLPLNQFVFLLL